MRGDKNWKKLTDTQLRVTIYHNLRVLLEETDERMFEVLLEKTVQNLKDSDTTCEFAEYFECYIKRKEEWEVWYQKRIFNNTNMYVEAFHLKYVSLNRRSDRMIAERTRELVNRLTRE